MKSPSLLLALLAGLAPLSDPRASADTLHTADTRPGLTLTFTTGGKSDARAARLVALEVPAGQPATPFLPAGPFTATWGAEILSDMRGEYSFAAEVQGTVKVSLNGAVIFEGSARVESNPVKLQKGANKLAVEFTSPAKGDAMLRLLWSSKEFPWEPVPPSVFQHDVANAELRGGEVLRAGRLLFAQLRCGACHDGAGVLPAKGEGLPELAQDAPQFAEVGAKFNEPWLAAWINEALTAPPSDK